MIKKDLEFAIRHLVERSRDVLQLRIDDIINYLHLDRGFAGVVDDQTELFSTKFKNLSNILDLYTNKDSQVLALLIKKLPSLPVGTVDLPDLDVEMLRLVNSAYLQSVVKNFAPDAFLTLFSCGLKLPEAMQKLFNGLNLNDLDEKEKSSLVAGLGNLLPENFDVDLKETVADAIVTSILQYNLEIYPHIKKFQNILAIEFGSNLNDTVQIEGISSNIASFLKLADIVSANIVNQSSKNSSYGKLRETIRDNFNGSVDGFLQDIMVRGDVFDCVKFSAVFTDARKFLEKIMESKEESKDSKSEASAPPASEVAANDAFSPPASAPSSSPRVDPATIEGLNIDNKNTRNLS